MEFDTNYFIHCSCIYAKLLVSMAAWLIHRCIISIFTEETLMWRESVRWPADDLCSQAASISPDSSWRPWIRQWFVLMLTEGIVDCCNQRNCKCRRMLWRWEDAGNLGASSILAALNSCYSVGNLYYIHLVGEKKNASGISVCFMAAVSSTIMRLN